MPSSSWENVQIICEGLTEELFVKNILNPYLKGFNLKLIPILIDGNVSTERIVCHINKTNTRIVTTFVDYYGLKGANNLSPEEIIQEINNKSGKEHLIPYLQMHETEALWFSDPETLCRVMNTDKKQMQAINNITGEFECPEDINNSTHTAPSKRLEKIFKGYSKTTDGIRIAKSIGIEQMKNKCPKFNNWLETLIDKANHLRNP